MLLSDIIDKVKMSESSKLIYRRFFNKIGIKEQSDLFDTNRILDIMNSSIRSDEYKKIGLNAICKALEGTEYYDYYNKLRNQIKNKIEYDKSYNVKTLPMTYNELLNVPNLVVNKDPLRELIDKFFIYMHVKYPLRLDYYNVPINPSNTDNISNYMTYKDKILTFYLNDFKNVNSIGPQVITYEDPFIDHYMETFQPQYLLYQYLRGEYVIFTSKVAFGIHLTNLIRKYTNKKVTINDIRKIHESHIIQSPDYTKLTNRQKNALHAKLLHKTATAHNAYNFIN